MKICFLGQPIHQVDEGMKSLGDNLARSFSTEHNVKYVPVHSILSLLYNLPAILRWNADIIHLIPGPTTKGLLLVALLRIATGSGTVITASNPSVKINSTIARRLKADVVVVQTDRDLERFDDLCFETELIPNGVDMDKFSPASRRRQAELRDEYGLPHDETVFLHVGHLKAGRGVLSLTKFQQWGHVVVVGSPSTNPDPDVVEQLAHSGVTVLYDYYPEVENIYQMSDVYVFPTKNKNNAIRMPVSVLEAMACDLPVISTKFGGLYEQLSGEQGVVFVEDVRDVSHEDVVSVTGKSTRGAAEHYSYDKITDEYQRVYKQYAQS